MWRGSRRRRRCRRPLPASALYRGENLDRRVRGCSRRRPTPRPAPSSWLRRTIALAHRGGRRSCARRRPGRHRTGGEFPSVIWRAFRRVTSPPRPGRVVVDGRERRRDRHYRGGARTAARPADRCRTRRATTSSARRKCSTASSSCSTPASGPLPVVDTQHRVIGADVCHLAAPATLAGEVDASGQAVRDVGAAHLRRRPRAGLAVASGPPARPRSSAAWRSSSLAPRRRASHLQLLRRRARRRRTSPDELRQKPALMPVILGSDVLFDRQLLRGRTIGLVCNPASIDAQFRHVVDRAEAAGVRVGAHLRPAARLSIGSAGEHDRVAARRRTRAGACRCIRSTARRASRRRRCSPASTRSSSICRTSARASTPTSTRWRNCLRAAARARPAGHRLRSAESDRRRRRRRARCSSRASSRSSASIPIPMRHGMTIGELARLFNEHFGIGAKLEVVAMQGWSRDQYFDETGLPWVLPSPNIPTLDSAHRLPGHGALRRHQRLGRPRHDAAVRARSARRGSIPKRFARGLNALGLPGVHFRPGAVRADVPQARQGRRAAAARST